MDSGLDEVIIAEEIDRERIEAAIRDMQLDLENARSKLRQLREWAWDEIGARADDDSDEAHAQRMAYEKHLRTLGHYMHNSEMPWTKGKLARQASKSAAGEP